MGGLRVRAGLIAAVMVAIVLGAVSAASAWTPVPVKQDPLVFMPGSQPGNVQNFENAGRCENCHSGYNPAVEPGSNWRGSMMAQAARDPLWLACLTVAAQDSIWAIGTPNATDICIRCHSPGGWLEGASDPTNTSRLSGNQFDGVHCDFCHRMQDPMMVQGQPDVPADTGTAATLAAQARTQTYADLGLLRLFDGVTPFLGANFFPTYYGTGFPGWSEPGAGQFFTAQSSGPKWGPRSQTVARHQFQYSRFHKSREFCHSCHDVSNPVLQNALSGLPGAQGTEKFAAASFFHVERTSSEFLLSAYGRGTGASADGIPGVAWAAKCQDCHMRDTTGKAANKADAPTYNDLALHDLTGGNTWISGILASADSGYAGYDAYNYRILSGQKYPGAKVDVAGLAGSGAMLARGRDRAMAQLKMAATLQEVARTSTALTLRVRNNTGHKLISGFPEGRRMFLNVRFYADAAGTQLVREVNGYDPLKITRDSAGNAVYAGGGTLTNKNEALVWEAEMSSSLTGESKSFHFALADKRYKDNRIPPKGFDKAAATQRKAEPVWHGESDVAYFSDAEYSGGYDEVTLDWPAGAVGYSAELFYQTTSREYIEFLRDEARGTGSLTLSSPTPSGEPKAYVVQTDPFFANLKGWGDAIWDLWLHNGGAAPVQMAVLNDMPTPPPAPTVDPPGGVKVTYNSKTRTAALAWTPPVTGADGYYIYRATTSGGYAYAAPLAKITSGAARTYTDSGPFVPGMYYYVLRSYKIDKLLNEFTSANSNEASMRIR